MPTNRKRSSLNKSSKHKNPFLVFRLMYLVLGVVLVLLPMIKPQLWTGSDENFVSFPLFFGLVFLVIAYVLGKGKSAAKWGALTTVVILIIMILNLTNLHGENIIGAPFLLIFVSIVNFAFVYTWVPYCLGLNLLSSSYSGKSPKEIVRKAVAATVVILILLALGWFAFRFF